MKTFKMTCAAPERPPHYVETPFDLTLIVEGMRFVVTKRREHASVSEFTTGTFVGSFDLPLTEEKARTLVQKLIDKRGMDAFRRAILSWGEPVNVWQEPVEPDDFDLDALLGPTDDDDDDDDDFTF